MSEPLFWCVWCENGGSPTVKHEQYSTARNEAKRLARVHPGKRFVVMAAAVGFLKSDLIETRFEGLIACRQMLDDEIPF